MCPARRWSLLPRDPLAKPRGLLRGNAHGTRNRALVPRSGGPDHSPLAGATAWVARTNPQSDGRGPTGLCRALTSRPRAGGMAGCRTLGMNRMHAADRPHTHVLVLNLGSATIAGAGQRGANPAASRPCVHPVGAHRAALCAAYRHCWSAYQSFVPGTSAVPPIRMRPKRSRGRAVGTDALAADGPPELCYRNRLFRGSALTVDTSLARPVRGNGTLPPPKHCPSGRRPDGPGRPRRRCRSSFADRWGASRCGSG